MCGGVGMSGLPWLQKEGPAPGSPSLAYSLGGPGPRDGQGFALTEGFGVGRTYIVCLTETQMDKQSLEPELAGCFLN